jgi:membrane protease YdiL (CAAX protease family)
MSAGSRLHSSLAGLLEVGVMFLPAIPAYLWVWGNLSGWALELFQALAYVYVLAATVFIGRRRYRWQQLGFNRQGLWLTLGCSAAILGGRLLIILSIDWNLSPPRLTWFGLVGQVLYTFFLVALTEELLFRGLVYRLLEDWRGARWAVWGSSVGFGLWHIFGQGALAGAAAFVIGLLYALIRSRAGGIPGLILLHALWDLETVLLVADSNAEILNSLDVRFSSPLGVWLGFGLLVLTPVYVWKLHPLVLRILHPGPQEP